MAIDFTNSPTNGNTYSATNGITYTYNGTFWESETVDSTGIFLSLSGGTMTGNLSMGTNKITNLATPTSSADATTKLYVDTAVAAVGTPSLSIAGDTGTDTVSVGVNTFTFSGTTNEVNTTVSDNRVTIGLPDNVTITSNATVGATLTVNGATILGDASTDTLTFNAKTLAVPNDLNVDGGTLYVDATNNRIGIGTTAPKGTLDVAGPILGAANAISASAIDCSLGSYFTKTISGATTFTITNAQSGRVQLLVLKLTNSGTNVTWPASVKWPSGTAPTLTTSGVDILVLISDDGGSTWYGKISMRDVK